MSENNENIPKIRFPGFTDAWEQLKLSEGMNEYTDRVFIEDDKVYKQVSVKNIGQITLRGEQEGSKIGRKRQAQINLTEHPNTLIFTRQTIEQGGIGFAPQETDGAIVTENMPTIDVDTGVFDKDYLMAYVKTVPFRKDVILPNMDGGTAQIAIHEDNVLKSETLFPKIDEQRKIGTFFAGLDRTLALHQRKLNHLQDEKKSLLQKMFPKKGEHVPEIRFPGFTHAWEQRKLKDVSNYSNGGSYENDVKGSGKYELVTLKSVDMSGNLVSSGKYINKEVTTLNQGTLVMILSEQSPGLLGMTTQIPMDNKYVLNQRVAEIRPTDKADSYFLSMAINRCQRYFSKRGAGTKVQNISKGNVENFEFLCPFLLEQQKIGAFFANFDHLITLHQRKLDHCKRLKKALLQQMFV